MVAFFPSKQYRKEKENKFVTINKKQPEIQVPYISRHPLLLPSAYNAILFYSMITGNVFL